MKVQRMHSAGFAALSSGLIFSSANAIVTTTSLASTGCVASMSSDGYCDNFNNIATCGYDGGDCCECTCVDTEDFLCGESGFACVDPNAPCVSDDRIATYPAYYDYYPAMSEGTSGKYCIPSYFSDGDCDLTNNEEACGYDGGDCCECTCVGTAYTCGDPDDGGYSCVDPSAPCVNDDDVTSNPEAETFSGTGYYTSSASSCLDLAIADGNCDLEYNNEECGYDGGDCCECTCVGTSSFACGDNDYDCIDPDASCFSEYVLASTKTNIRVSANAFDARPGEDSGDVGCGEGGCTPALTRDGVTDDVESRWSCNQIIVPDGELCEIEFVFQDPQDIMEVQVAFWKGDIRSRTVEAAINGEVIGEFDSYPGSTFNTLDIEGVGVHSVALTSVNVTDNGWISLIEVRFLVGP